MSYTYDRATGAIFMGGAPIPAIYDSHGYLIVFYNGRYISQHRLAWYLVTGQWPEFEIDHVNRKRGDNRWCNLREATKAQNAQNRGVHKNNLLGVRGIRHRPDGRYEPRIMVAGKAKYLGLYPTLEEAIAVRKAAEKEYFSHAR